MNLYMMGDTILNMDRVNCVRDHRPAAEPGAPAGQEVVLRILFDGGSIDLAGEEAAIFRRWLRGHSHNLSPRVDEDGEELIAPEAQLLGVLDNFLEMVDDARPRDAQVRGAAHRLGDMVNSYVTGQLRPMRLRAFRRRYESARSEAANAEGPAST